MHHAEHYDVVQAQKSWKIAIFFPCWYAFGPNMGPNVPEITQNPKIMIPYVIRVILVPYTWPYL